MRPDTAWATLKTFSSRLLLLAISMAAFGGAVALNGLRPPKTPEGAINAKGLAPILRSLKGSSPFAEPLAGAVLRVSQEAQATRFESADALYRSAARVLRQRPDPRIEEWTCLPEKREHLIKESQEKLEEIDARAIAAAAELRVAKDETHITSRERLTDIVANRQIVETKYRRELAAHDFRAATLDVRMRETFQRGIDRLETYGRAGRQRKSLIETISASFTDDESALFPAYELLWYAALTIAVFSLAAFLFQTFIRALPVETETTLRERMGEIVQRAPASVSGALATRTGAVVGLAALGISAAAVLPNASPVVLDPWQSPMTQFGLFSTPTVPQPGLRGEQGTAGVAGSTGSAGDQGPRGLPGANGENGTLQHLVRVEKVEVSVPETWKTPLQEAKNEFNRSIDDTKTTLGRTINSNHQEAVEQIGKVSTRVDDVKQDVQGQKYALDSLDRSQQSLVTSAAGYATADRDDIAQKLIWDDRPWWRRMFRTLYTAGPVATRVVKQRYQDTRPALVASFEAMSASVATAKKMPREEFLNSLYDTMISKSFATDRGHAAQLLNRGDVKFILNASEVEQ